MRWFRVYDDAINDPKILKLPEALRWHWIALLCVASRNEGILPCTADVALSLRVTPSKASAIIAGLTNAGLLDKTETGFAPHNWNGRQYKSDVSTERVKRFRNGKRNVSPAVSETAPETEADTDTEPEHIPEAYASGADAPVDHRKRLFNEGLSKLAAMTGKGPDACRSFVGKCLKAASDDAIIVLGLIEDAERNKVVDPSAWIAARLKPAAGSSSAKPLTEFQRKQQETNNVRQMLRDSADASRRGGTVDRYLPDDNGQRSADLRGGTGPYVLAIPRASGTGGDRS